MLKRRQKGIFQSFRDSFLDNFQLYIMEDLELAPPFLGIGDESTVCCQAILIIQHRDLSLFSQEPQSG